MATFLAKKKSSSGSSTGYRSSNSKSSNNPKSKSSPTPYNKRLNIILDIDETLIYFINAKVRGHSWDSIASEEQAKYAYISPGAHIMIFRPHLKQFLSFLFKNFRVSLWTMSERDYAHNIANVLLKLLKAHPDRKFAHIFSADDDADHDESAHSLHGNNKDLNWLWYKYANDYSGYAECNTVLIDDLPANACNTSNRNNAIKVEPFALFGEVKRRTDPYEDVSQDNVLPQLKTILKKVLVNQRACHDDDEARWQNVFSLENVENMGLESKHKKMTFRGKSFKMMMVDRE